MSVLEARYAIALLSAASSPDVADKMEEDVDAFSILMQENYDMRNFMLNPAISRKIKKETVNKIFTTDTPQLLNNFVALLVDKGRISLLSGICKEYKRLKAEMRRNLMIKVFSALPLDEAQLSDISENYIKKYGSLSAEVEFKIDPSLLGGVLIRIGDFCIDNSLLGRLSGIRSTVVGK